MNNLQAGEYNPFGRAAQAKHGSNSWKLPYSAGDVWDSKRNMQCSVKIRESKCERAKSFTCISKQGLHRIFQSLKVLLRCNGCEEPNP